jgi:hypothetical protein
MYLYYLPRETSVVFIEKSDDVVGCFERYSCQKVHSDVGRAKANLKPKPNLALKLQRLLRWVFFFFFFFQ